MPELPEVETVVRSLRKVFAKNHVTDISYLRKDLRFPIPKRKINKVLKGQETIKTERRGKYILLHTDLGSTLIHLGMSGQMILAQKSDPLAKHTHVILSLSKDKDLELRYIDPRRFGLFEAVVGADWQSHKLLVNLGVEPLNYKPLGQMLYDLARKRTVPVKNFIMNSNIVVGVGNIYACEALYKAKIHPLTPAKLLSLEDFKRLSFEIVEVLKRAIKQGGTTLKDFRSLKNESGYFQVKLAVYGREGEECTSCYETIERFAQSGRSSWICPKCQPLLS